MTRTRTRRVRYPRMTYVPWPFSWIVFSVDLTIATCVLTYQMCKIMILILIKPTIWTVKLTALTTRLFTQGLRRPPHRHIQHPAGAWRFNPPPGWPHPPAGWMPPQGWVAPADWPTAPLNWQWWTQEPADPPTRPLELHFPAQGRWQP